MIRTEPILRNVLKVFQNKTNDQIQKVNSSFTDFSVDPLDANAWNLPATGVSSINYNPFGVVLIKEGPTVIASVAGEAAYELSLHIEIVWTGINPTLIDNSSWRSLRYLDALALVVKNNYAKFNIGSLFKLNGLKPIESRINNRDYYSSGVEIIATIA